MTSRLKSYYSNSKEYTNLFVPTLFESGLFSFILLLDEFIWEDTLDFAYFCTFLDEVGLD